MTLFQAVVINIIPGPYDFMPVSSFAYYQVIEWKDNRED